MCLEKSCKTVREKSRDCHNHKPQPFPDPKRKRKPTNPNKHKPNKRTKSTKTSPLFPKRGNRNTKRTEKQKNKMTHGKTTKQQRARLTQANSACHLFILWPLYYVCLFFSLVLGLDVGLILSSLILHAFTGGTSPDQTAHWFSFGPDLYACDFFFFCFTRRAGLLTVVWWNSPVGAMF